MTTNNHPANGPVSLDLLHQISEILSKAAAQSDGGNIGYAMADAVKVIDEVLELRRNYLALRGEIEDVQAQLYEAENRNEADATELQERRKADSAEPIYQLFDAGWYDTNKSTYYDVTGAGMKGRIVYAAPQQASLVPDEKPMPEASKMHAIDAVAAIAEVRGWNACRTAMLQAGNYTEQCLDMVEYSGDANENVDCRLPFDQWLSQQNEPIDVDCGCVTTEAFYHWLRVAYEAGNSPVIPDGYVLVPKEMTPEMMRAVQIKSELGGYAASELSGAYDMFSEFWDVAVSAAP